VGELPHPPSSRGFVYLKFAQDPAPPLFSGGESFKQATVVGFIYLKFARRTAPPPFSGVPNAPCTLSYMSFSVPCLLFSFFFQDGGQTVQGARLVLSQGWLWEYHMLLICSTLGLLLPGRLGASIWWHGSPPGFSV
jgi:hypothetical protein